MIAVVIFMIVGYLFIHNHEWDKIELEAGESSTKTWKEYEDECGKIAYNSNPIRAVTMYEKQWQGKSYLWEGVVQRIREGIDMFFIQTKSLLFLQMAHAGAYVASWEMSPTDIVLMFDSDLNEKVAMLKPGNKISFNATLFGLGRRGSPHVMHMWDVNDLGAGETLAVDDISDSDFEKDKKAAAENLEAMADEFFGGGNEN